MTSKLLDATLWYIPDFPKCNWRHIKVIDTGSADKTCQACGKTDVRHIHHLEHDGWDDIEVGCVCAGKLINNPELAKSLERNSKNRAKRRENWLERKWTRARTGNLYIKDTFEKRKYYVVIIKSKYGHFKFFAKIGKTEYEGTKWYDTWNEAALIAFDALF